MPSRDKLSRYAEGFLRAVVIGLLAWYLVQVIRARRHGPEEGTSSETLRESLARWSTVASPEVVL